MARYRKSRMWAPQGFFECEGRGLQWLGEAQAQGGPRVVDVYEWGKDFLDIERVSPCSPTAKAAHDFGAALARMHDAGTDHFGSAPAGYDGTCYFGPLQDPVPMATGAWDDPITYFAQGRLVPMVELGMRRGELTQADMDAAIQEWNGNIDEPRHRRDARPSGACGAGQAGTSAR